MRSRRLLALITCLLPSLSPAATVLVLQFHNNSRFTELNWVGESTAETVRVELGAAGEIVLARDSRTEGLRRLGLRPDAEFTKATLIKLGQTLDVDYLCYGAFDVVLPPSDSQLKASSLQISAKFLDLRKLHDGPQLAEAGKLTELSRLNEHIAWQALKYIKPSSNVTADQFLTPHKLVRLDAEESYMRGLLASRGDQQEKWFAQALLVEPHYAGPAFELGQLNLEKKAYRQAVEWFGRIPVQDPRYDTSRFKMGLAAYRAGDYINASTYFRDVSKSAPLNEVFNNLGATEIQLGQAAAVDDCRKAVDGDANDPVYRFNLGLALLRNGVFDEAQKSFQLVVNQDPNDREAKSMLDRAMGREPVLPATRLPATSRLKLNFDETAFRQLKAMLQPKGL